MVTNIKCESSAPQYREYVNHLSIIYNLIMPTQGWTCFKKVIARHLDKFVHHVQLHSTKSIPAVTGTNDPCYAKHLYHSHASLT